MLISSLLVILGVICRVVPHPPNAVAMGAIALYAGARLPRRWAWSIPVVAMLLADLFLDWGTNRPFLASSRWFIYAAFLPIALMGRFAKNSSNPMRLAGLSISASLWFFVVSNLGVWALDTMYPMTAAGLVACFTAAIPYFGTGDYGFFANGIVADLTGVGVLFGFDALVRTVRSRREAPVGAELVADH